MGLRAEPIIFLSRRQSATRDKAIQIQICWRATPPVSRLNFANRVRPNGWSV